ncbi:MAG: ATP-dependent DNA ligase [Verrucomicrobiae bacterium]|nr:ATP-dependent DNA ligase [Verrucomicrobiae bacterium]
MRIHREILCSLTTAQLIQARLHQVETHFITPKYGNQQKRDGLTYQLLPAGHVFGSAMLWATDERESLLYTGDFKLRKSQSSETCQPIHADTLVMETTFGLPYYQFPSTQETLQQIIQFCRDTLSDGETPILLGYSLGKSQEILACLHEAKLPITLHPSIYEITQAYEKLGISFPAYEKYDPQKKPLKDRVFLCPPHLNHSRFIENIPHKRTAMMSGWALDPNAIYRYQCDYAFPLSDHADYSELLTMVERVKPKRILTVHGYAEQFAADLRARGWEAWALSQENQLEWDIFHSSSSSSIAVTTFPTPEGIGTFYQFAQCGEKVKQTASKKEKVRLIAELLQQLPPDEMPLATLFFTGRVFAQTFSKKLQIGSALIKQAVLHITHLTPGDYRQAYSRFSDTSETVNALLQGRTQPQPTTLVEIQQFLQRLETSRGLDFKIFQLSERLHSLTSLEAKYLIKIITGDLRIGLKEGLVEEAIASAFQTELHTVRQGNMLTGDIAHVAQLTQQKRLHEVEITPFRPVQVMLASPEPTSEAIFERLGANGLVEYKFDGIRCQLHKVDTRVELYSRDMKPLNATFPDVVTVAQTLTQDFILDGEILAFEKGRPLPFQRLQMRLGRKEPDLFISHEVPVIYFAFDMLWHNNRSLLHLPLKERRAHLDTQLDKNNPGIQVAEIFRAKNPEALETLFRAARRAGNEGLLIKDPESPYTPGRRGLAWLKLKKELATLDVVVVGAEQGHGKRRDVLSDVTFAVQDDSGKLRILGKAYSGLTDLEIEELTEHFLKTTLEIRGRYRVLKPTIILEIAFDAIAPSSRHDSGYALRFPRIKRIRDDKTIREIDTLAHCKRLATS